MCFAEVFTLYARNGLYSALMMTLQHEMGMDIDEILTYLALIKLTNNGQDFT